MYFRKKCFTEVKRIKGRSTFLSLLLTSRVERRMRLWSDLLCFFEFLKSESDFRWNHVFKARVTSSFVALLVSWKSSGLEFWNEWPEFELKFWRTESTRSLLGSFLKILAFLAIEMPFHDWLESFVSRIMDHYIVDEFFKSSHLMLRNFCRARFTLQNYFLLHLRKLETWHRSISIFRRLHTHFHRKIMPRFADIIVSVLYHFFVSSLQK